MANKPKYITPMFKQVQSEQNTFIQLDKVAVKLNRSLNEIINDAMLYAIHNHKTVWPQLNQLKKINSTINFK